MLETTPQERMALGVMALLLIAGTAVRVATLRDPRAEWEAAAADTMESGGAGGVRARVAAQIRLDSVAATPLGAGERIDPNRASAAELERLPRVGPGLARRIVQRRTEQGLFRSMADIDSIPGFGPALLAEVAPHLALPAAPREGAAGRADGKLDLNAATAAELEALPGVGPALAARIVAWRGERGRFGSVSELDSVPGFGPALLLRVTPLVRVRP